MIGGAIDALCTRRTRAIFLESPGSLTFEVQDVPAIVAVAKARGIVTLMDNTWATPLYFRAVRSEEHTSELQSLMRISYAVFCLKKKNTQAIIEHLTNQTKKLHEDDSRHPNKPLNSMRSDTHQSLIEVA